MNLIVKLGSEGQSAANTYHIGEAINQTAPHHQSFKALWETKWKKPCEMGIYPFMFGCIRDFEPVAEEMFKKNLREPYDWDEYAESFFPKAKELADAAQEAENQGEMDKAAEYFLRSSALYRVARFPAPRSPKQFEAWRKGKEVFYKGQSPLRKKNSLLPHPITEVAIPHTHGLDNEGKTIPVNYLVPATATSTNPAPTILIITGLDGYRTELAVWQEGFRQKGVATIVAEIPGTGDSPASKQDPTSPDRQWSSVLDWMDAQPQLDNQRVIAWGFSTGGYYALRIGHTHHSRLQGAISLGGGAHHMFDAKWLKEVNKLEYPFDLANTLAYKFGYGDDDDDKNNGLESFIAQASGKFSLVNDGTLDKPCTRILLVNGTEDEIFPIEDLFVALSHGMSRPKEARLVKGKKHMGEPESFVIVLRWIYDLLGLEGDCVDQLKLIMFKAKY